MSEAKYEELEHTGDVGLRIRGTSLAELFVHAAEGMFSLIGRASFAEDELRTRRLEIAVVDRAEDLYQWLRALLLDFNLHGFFPTQISLDFQPGRISALLRGGTFDPARHDFFTEIKAVTQHGLRVVGEASGPLEAEVIFDV
jgi:SHS2 domain-containing protein